MHLDSTRAVDLPCDSIDDPALSAIYAWWLRAKGDRPYPAKADIDPNGFKAALPYVALIESTPRQTSPKTPPRLRIRLTGEEIRNTGRGFAAGCYVEDISPGWYRDHLLQTYRTALAAAVPVFQRVHANYQHKEFHYYRLMLPIGAPREDAPSGADAAPCFLLVATLQNKDLRNLEPDGGQLQ